MNEHTQAAPAASPFASIPSDAAHPRRAAAGLHLPPEQARELRALLDGQDEALPPLCELRRALTDGNVCIGRKTIIDAGELAHLLRDACAAISDRGAMLCDLSDALARERHESFSDGVILALQIMASGGDTGSHQYEELLNAADAVSIYKRAHAEGMLELSGLADYVAREDHARSRALRRAVARAQAVQP